MSERQKVTPESPALTPSEINEHESSSSSPTGSKRSGPYDQQNKRVKLNTPDVTLSPALEGVRSSPENVAISRLTDSTTGLFGIFNNPILVLDLLEMTPDVNDGDVALTSTQNENKAEAFVETSSQTSDVAIMVPGATMVSESDVAVPQLTKRQIERMEKQKQREIERAERERKKEEEKRVKAEEKERKDRERQLKKELLEKEKEKKREEERLRKEERKKKLEDDRKRKEEEKRLKEEEKKQKEEEKKQKEEEKRMKEEQKERSQMKISSFFSVKPTAKATPRAVTPSTEKVEATQAGTFHLQFLPFFVKKNVIMAPSGSLPPEKLSVGIAAFDVGMESGKKASLSELVPPLALESSSVWTTSEQLVNAMNASNTTEESLHQLVEHLPPVKYLQFYENSKPPYIGTWCSESHMATTIGATNPLDTQLTGFDYDYDSDLDWQDDDDEGEDIDDLEDDEDDEEGNDEDDMDDFVDNDATKRRLPVSTLEAVSRWNTGSVEDMAHFDQIRYERLDYDIHFPIDPFKDYWGKTTETPTKSKEVKRKESKISKEVKTENDAETTNVKDVKPRVLTPKRAITDKTVVAALIKFVEKNSDFTIGTLSELAKKEFKTYTKSMLKYTIQEVASYNKKKSIWEIKTT